ncbi:type IV toxin-antitoxin system AbiEi family antitoxin domain-containing protein [Aquisalimonas lutea]|uniref:type IV toxin-antitoxin system AbiEi family antitoxin domain-containing protein n=1 Tax=Aquisalimonas lutea TaxID=1327750 RepID=UPI0025B5040C|nr:type IV toxin-antitoxin system AbiEi family antitoxin domain-containing protein [Aquisalimonas lutea]MDN3519026.1 type IV toxin-antitoxin system AbiEi family antitoxin domain-containing protein [Aquisalimonas lutea]
MPAKIGSEKTSQRDRALTLLASQGMARLSEFRNAGVAQETVARLAREGTILRLARGLYQLPDNELDINHSLAEIAKLVPRGVICLLSATQFHQLTVHTSSTVWVAIERTARKPAIKHPPLRIVRFSGAAYSMGVEEHLIEGVPVRIYSPAKTAVDCFRYRNKVGLDVALEALREGLRQRRFTTDELYRHATATRTWKVMEPYMEALLTDGT